MRTISMICEGKTLELSWSNTVNLDLETGLRLTVGHDGGSDTWVEIAIPYVHDGLTKEDILTALRTFVEANTDA